jgi:hypothetical protein
MARVNVAQWIGDRRSNDEVRSDDGRVGVIVGKSLPVSEHVLSLPLTVVFREPDGSIGDLREHAFPAVRPPLASLETDDELLEAALQRWATMVANGFARDPNYVARFPSHQDLGSVLRVTAVEGPPPPAPCDDVARPVNGRVIVEHDDGANLNPHWGLTAWEEAVTVRIGPFALLVLGEGDAAYEAHLLVEDGAPLPLATFDADGEWAPAWGDALSVSFVVRRVLHALRASESDVPPMVQTLHDAFGFSPSDLADWRLARPALHMLSDDERRHCEAMRASLEALVQGAHGDHA